MTATKNIRQSRFICRVVLPLALIAMSACHTTRLKSQGYAPFNTSRELPSPARLTLNDGSNLSLRRARSKADSVRHIENKEGDSAGIAPYLLAGAAVLAIGFVVVMVQMDEMFGEWGE